VRLDTDSGSGGIAGRVPAAGLGAVADAIPTAANSDAPATPDARAERRTRAERHADARAERHADARAERHARAHRPSGAGDRTSAFNALTG
jgi:hypothetical protein